MKGAKTFSLDNQPINGISGNFGVVILLIFVFVWMIVADGGSKFVSLLAIIPLIYRVYSYFAYERYVEK
ncbi:hypothetical protein [Bacillus suaedaesalsae]|uniref:Uncharacterized protein n=1 Tax=Bacillus suaedaesalsae TaxID=2810349 RepID=A0ABS2DLS9_9BACI|nr:hypothetical protein [Bacillus suaedaesalsae]MBM6619449.1 hypothetical protein [Bacillus suaedaesalsae]